MTAMISDLSAEVDKRVGLARAHFFNGSIVPSGLVADTIARSWVRCSGLGLNASAPVPLPMTTSRELRERKARNRLLLEVAQPELENLYQQIANTRSVVLLTDAEATVLTSLSIDDPLTRRGGRPGACWLEDQVGTNAIGTAVIEQQAISVFGSEHYLEQNGVFSCSAAPVFNPFGKLIGVLDISGGNQVRQPHIQALAGMSAQVIENRLFFAQLGMHTIVRFHSRPEFLGTLWEALAVFAQDGSLVAVNRAALLVLEINRTRLHQDDFATLFDFSFDRLLDYFSAPGRSPLLIHMRNGVRVYASARPAESAARSCSDKPAAPGTPATASALFGGRGREEMCLSDITLGDVAMTSVLDKARRTFAAGIPVLIEGETGSGKEVLARALHQDSSRAAGPFIAINCASIPETLIEAELFGYREGAFTGARRGGSIGKLQQANKGTLFLDEIGDMPLSMQARLLRALQEREIVPLGGDKVIPIDIAVICATHMNLKERVANGFFREDLYYRLHGLRVTLPPLRERKNMREIIMRIVQTKSKSDGTRRIAVSQEVLDAFLSHPWPGNMRQLCNVVATALALLGDDERIELQHLTDDFLKEMIERRAQPSPPNACGTLAAMEAQAVRMALERHCGNISATATALGISRATLYRKIKQ